MPHQFLAQHGRERGRHEAYAQSLDGKYVFQASPSGDYAALLARYNANTDEIQQIVQECLGLGKRLRAYGSLWSLSRVAVNDGRLISTARLRIALPPPPSQVAPGVDAQKLRFFECGNPISQVNQVLFAGGLSLKASGANNGQTVVGATSTGTHGSAFHEGAVHDGIVGIHLVVGPGKHVYLERASRPVTRDAFGQSLGAEVIRDDELFDAAVVSFGSFGVIHGVMIEARPLFLLHAVRFRHPYDATLRQAIQNLDVSGLVAPNLPAGVPTDRPYHFELISDPNAGNPPGEVILLLMYEDAVPADYEIPPWDEGSAGLGSSGLDVMASLQALLALGLPKAFLRSQIASEFADKYEKGVIRDLFRGEKQQGPALATAAAMPGDRILEALAITYQEYHDLGKTLPLVVSVRRVQRTPALLGFTRYDQNAVLEIDGINAAPSRKFVGRVWNKLVAAGIPFAVHWGKWNDWLTPTRVRSIYGSDLIRWTNCRKTLFESPAVQKIFDNDFVQRLELDQ